MCKYTLKDFHTYLNRKDYYDLQNYPKLYRIFQNKCLVKEFKYLKRYKIMERLWNRPLDISCQMCYNIYNDYDVIDWIFFSFTFFNYFGCKSYYEDVNIMSVTYYAFNVYYVN